MQDDAVTKEQLLAELGELRKRVTELEKERVELKRVEEALRRSETRYRVLYESLRDAFAQVSMDGRIIEFNDLYCRMLGYSPDELRALTYQELTPERWHALEDGIVREQVIPRGYSDIYEKEYRRKDGTTIPVELRTILSRDPSGRPNAMWAVVRDISERKRAEEELRRNQAALVRAQRIARIGNWDWDLVSGKIVWSDTIFHIFGLEPREPSHELARSLAHPEDLDFWERSLRESIFEGKPFCIDYRALRPDGATIWIHSEAEIERDPDGAALRIFGTSQEITGRKHAEEKLEQYKQIVSYTPDAISLLGKDYRYRIVNDAYETFSGIEREQILGLTVAEYLGETVFRDLVKSNLDRCLNGETVKYQAWFEYPTLGRRFIDVTYFPYIDTNNEIAGIVASSRDITDIKRTEENLRESEARLRSILDHTPALVFMKDLEGRYIAINRRCEQVLGVSNEDIMGKTAHEFLPKEVADQFTANDRRVMESAAPRKVEESIPARHGNRTFLSVQFPLFDSSGAPYAICGISTDITDRKKAEEALKRSRTIMAEAERLAHLGAWEWNIAEDHFEFSDNWRRIHGARGRVLPRDELESIAHPDDLEAIENAFRNALSGIRPYDIEHRIIRQDDHQIRYVHAQGYVIRDEAGIPSRMYGVAQDITKRKEMEQELQDARELLEERVRIRTAELLTINEQLTREMEERNRAEEVVRIQRDLAVALGSVGSLDEAMKILLNAVLRIGGMDSGGVYLVNDTTGELRLSAHKGLSPRFVERVFHYRPDSPQAGFVVRGEPVYWSYPVNVFETVDLFKKEGIKALASIPVKWGNRIVGALNLASHEYDSIPLVIRSAIEATASQTGSIIARIRTEESLRESERELRRLSSRLLSAQEEERKRIAHELHDSIGSSLGAIRFSLANTLERMEKGPAAPDFITDAVSIVDRTIEDARRIYMDLRPSMLDHLGIIPTIGWYTRQFRKIYSGVRIETEIRAEEEDIPEPIKIVVFRIMQEALNNIAKYSEATLVKLVFRVTGRAIELSIADNGKGFHVGSVSRGKDSTGLGLTGMKERAENSGGIFEIESATGAGTTIRVVWPATP